MSVTPQAVPLPASLSRYRFGTFELDVQSGELRKNGAKQRLQDQPFLVLRKLLEGAGTVVAREDLHAALWPADTFVDFDTSLNTAIKRLREVLGDSAEVPVFIETIPRRGYRFLAPVQVIRNGGLFPVQSSTVDIVADHLPARHIRVGVVLGSLLLAAIAGALIVTLRTSAPVPRVSDSTQITFDGLAKGNVHARRGQIYFNESSFTQVSLVQVPAIGGTPVVLASAFPALYIADVSPDGSKLLVGSPVNMEKGPYRLKLMDLASGSLQNIDGIECDAASWASGGHLTFVKGNDIFLANADGSSQRKLLTAPGPPTEMRFSPDGTRMRFTVGNKHIEQHTLWEARADGSGLHEILTSIPNLTERCCGEWSPDGRYYFFQTERNGASRIWALPETHSFWTKAPAPIELTTVPPNFYMGGISEDGKKLYVTASQPRAELVRYDSLSKQFVPFLSGISAGDVEASRDGQFFTYVRYPELALWRARADGSQAAQLTGPSLRAALPHWSPDGQRIAFAGSRPGKPWNIFLISAAGGPAEQITNGAIWDLDPTWSPDGSTLAFGQARIEDNKQTVSIQLLDMASRRTTLLPGSEGICCPRWSPDGRFLIAEHPNSEDILLYEFATQKWSVLVKNVGRTGYMQWSRDSKEIFFDTLEVPEPGFYRMRISDQQPQAIAGMSGLHPYYGPFGPWTGVTPDGSPLLVRDISNEEVYSLDLQLP
jgi:Tol biopolymer transport system component/DNA-binding winged helix-turn-helix (wHTH) protein